MYKKKSPEIKFNKEDIKIYKSNNNQNFIVFKYYIHIF